VPAEPSTSHPGPPKLSLAGGAFAPPLQAVGRGKLVFITVELTVDEAALLRARVWNRRSRKPVRLDPRSGLRVVALAAARTSVGLDVPSPATVRLRLAVHRDRVERGKRYLIIVRAADRDGDASELRIPFRV
jgi:hypothetical protein